MVWGCLRMKKNSDSGDGKDGEEVKDSVEDNGGEDNGGDGGAEQ